MSFEFSPDMQASDWSPVRFRRGFQTPLRAGEYCPFHQHPMVELVYHPVGRGITRLERAPEDPIPYHSGTVVIYPASWTHDQRMAEHGTDCCLHFSCERTVPKVLSSLCLFHEVDDPYLTREMEALSRPGAIIDPSEQAIFDLRMMTLLLGLWTYRKNRSGRTEKPSSETTVAAGYVKRAKQYLSKHLTDGNATRNAARRLGISHDYLRHLFVQEEGETVTNCLRDLRVQRVCELLRHTPLPLKAIAGECGFQNERYLCTVFRNQTGMTPGQYRQTL